MTGKQRKQFWNVIQITLILIAAFIMLIPIIWIFLAAFKTHVDVYQLKLFFTPTLENFGTVFDAPYNLGDKLIKSCDSHAFCYLDDQRLYRWHPSRN